MQKLSIDEFEALRSAAKVVEKDAFGEKVLLLTDGTYLKLFRRKRWLSKNLLHPPALRFADNITKLQALGIPCPNVIRVFKLSTPYRSVVHYHPLQGATLRQLLKDGQTKDLLENLAEFINHLHNSGIYFRSLHPGNIIMTPEKAFGLIDVSDLRVTSGPLPKRLRIRNYRHLFRYHEDWKAVDEQALERFKRKLSV